MVAPEPLDYSDITVNRHGGNENSAAANIIATPGKKYMADVLLDLITKKKQCAHDLEKRTGKAMNKWSGRLTKLKADGLIEEVGDCRHRPHAAIYAAKGSK